MSNALTSTMAGILFLLSVSDSLIGATISVPNASFESPSFGGPNPNLNSWQKIAKPDWYDDGGGSFLWSQLTGAFRNTTVGSSNYIDNCDGLQALWLFAVPEVCLFQDYDSMDWNDIVPSHDFNATFEPGKAYQLTVGVIGTGGNMLQGVTLDLSLYYRDAFSNRIAVATTTMTNTYDVFSNNTHFVDCRVPVPVVKATDAWAGKKIGIQFLSTVSTNLQGGYWDLDNVRLVSNLAPILLNPVRTNGQFQFTLQSEPGLTFQILTSTNLVLPASNWTNLGFLTNITGSIPFVDTSSNFPQRFYQARQLP
jgi:hypothetical protein